LIFAFSAFAVFAFTAITQTPRRHVAANCSLRKPIRSASGTFRFRCRAGAVLDLTQIQTLLAQHHAVRDAHQLHVGEHHAGARLAIVEQYVDAA